MKDRVPWSCSSCKRVGSIPMEERFRTDAVARSRALNADHQLAQALSDAQHPLCTENVEHVPEWMWEGILREKSESPRYQFVVSDRRPCLENLLDDWPDIAAASDEEAIQELERIGRVYRRVGRSVGLSSPAETVLLYKNGKIMMQYRGGSIKEVPAHQIAQRKPPLRLSGPVDNVVT